MVRARWQVSSSLPPSKVSRARQASTIQVSLPPVSNPTTATSTSVTRKSRWVSTKKWSKKVGWSSLQLPTLQVRVSMVRCTNSSTNTIQHPASSVSPTPKRQRTHTFARLSSATPIGSTCSSPTHCSITTPSASAAVPIKVNSIHRCR